MKKVLGLAIFLAVAQVAQAADIEAGKDLAAAVCAACHGANGVSVGDALPNLAAQRAAYIEAQLKLYKDGTRKAPGATSPTLTMQAIAAQLSAEDIANTAAYFASLPGAAAGAKSPQLIDSICFGFCRTHAHEPAFMRNRSRGDKHVNDRRH